MELGRQAYDYGGSGTFVLKHYRLDHVLLLGRDKGASHRRGHTVGRATTLDSGLGGEATGVEILAGVSPATPLVLP